MPDQSKLTPEEVAALLEGAVVPKSVLFYIMLGGIARLRNLVQTAATRGGMDDGVASSHFGDVQSGAELDSPV